MLNLSNICTEVNESNKKLLKLHKSNKKQLKLHKSFLKVQKTFEGFTLSKTKHFLRYFVVTTLNKKALNKRMLIKDPMYDLCFSGVARKN